MTRSVDTNTLFEKCMKKSTLNILTARNVVKCLVAPFAFYCDKFISAEEKDKLTEFDIMLMKKGQEHEVKVINEKYPNITKIQYDTPEDGFKFALKSMIDGVDSLNSMPIFYLPVGLYGSPDILEKSTESNSIFGNYHYVVKEIKLAKNIKEKHLIQGAFYNYVIGQIQEYTPETFSIINRDEEETSHNYSEYESLLFETIDHSRRIIQGESTSPTYGEKESSPWRSYCDKKAIEANDISLVAGISTITKKNFLGSRFKTINDIANTSVSELTKINRIGRKTAIKYIANAKAIISGTHTIIHKDIISFPDKKREIFLDLEGINSTNADQIPPIDYLIGILVRINSKEKYIPFVSNDLEHEKQMLLEFLNYMKQQKDYVIYHYHNYESTHLKKMMEKYEIDNETQGMVLDNMIDIHKVATNSIIFPTYGNGLKQLAKYVGFSWRHKDISATESIKIYLDFVEEPKANETSFQKVKDYNEDDCIATRILKDWLVSEKSSVK